MRGKEHWWEKDKEERRRSVTKEEGPK